MAEFLARLREALSDQYAVERELGRGGMATVYLARDLRHRRDVAIKTLDFQGTTGVARFQREIEIAARLNHPHIVPLLNSGSFLLDPRFAESAVPYYVMPYVAGETLRDRLMREGRIPAPEAMRLAREAADALDYAHRHGVVHRDIKPENIMLSEGHALITDFGVARAVGIAGQGRITFAGLAIGSPNYMSPEQVEGRDDIDGRSDVYSLACTLYEMLTGAAPHSGGAARQTMTRRLTEPPPTVRSSGVQVSPALEAVLQRAMAPSRNDRFATAGEFAAALAGVEGPARKGSRVPLLTAFVAGAVLVGGALLVRVRAAERRDPITTIAILPLVHASADSTSRYVSMGMHEAVADLLRGLPQLRVTAPSLVMQLQRQRPAATTEELGRELGVGAVLTWDVRPTPDSLHVRAELLEIPGGSLLWSSRYDRPFSDIMAIQADIARTISDSLRITLRGEDVVRLARTPTRDPVTYDLYLKGLWFTARASPFGATLARERGDSVFHYADLILARDPDFAGGHYLLSEAYILAGFRGWRRPFAAVLDSARTAFERAFARDSSFAAGRTNRGVIGLYLEDDWAAARRELRAGVQLDPDLAYARQYYGIYLGEIEGRHDSAIAQLEHAVRLDPIPLFLNTLGDLLMRARRYDSALNVLQAAVAYDAQLPGPWTRIIQCSERLGRWQEAIKARRSAPDTSGAGAFAAAFAREGEVGYRRLMERDIRRRIDSLSRALEGPRDEIADTVPPLREGRIALLYAQLGEWSRAMDWVLRETGRRPRRVVWFVVHPDLEGLKNDPRFLPLVRDAGLSDRLR